MKLFLNSCVLSLVGLSAARVASRQQLHQDFIIVNSTTDPLVDVFNPALGVDSPLPPPSPEAIWHKAYCRGAALVRAMSLSEEESNAMLEWPYTQSPWDGDLKPELRTWGYLDDDTEHAKVDDSCDFDKRFFMKNIFAALGVDTRSWPGTDFVVGSDDEAEAEAALALIGKPFSHLPILLPYTFISGNGQSLTLTFC
jgi:hypothetical protein